MIGWADLARKGAWAEGPTILDNTHSSVVAIRYIWTEQNKVRAKLGLTGEF